jgi:two-component system, cell cycle response regulator DivK
MGIGGLTQRKEGENMPGKKILIIDDEPDILSFLTALLRDHGYETCSAKDGEEGWSKACEEDPDLICMDLLMPQKSGVKLYGQIRKDPRLQRIPVVMITGYGPPEYPGIDFKKFIHHRSAVLPPDGYLEKPIHPKALLETIAAIFEKRPSGEPREENG